MIKLCDRFVPPRREGRARVDTEFRCGEIFLAARAVVAMRLCTENLIRPAIGALLQLTVLLLALSPGLGLGAEGPRGMCLYPYP